MADHGKGKKGHGGGGHGGGDEGGGGGHGAPLWVVSFCDMTILEMSFFIILLSGASQKTAADSELLRILASIKAGFGYVPKQDSTEKMDMAVLQVIAQKMPPPGTDTARNQMKWTPPAIRDKKSAETDAWVRVKGGIGKPIIFPEDSDQVPLEAQSKLDDIAEDLRHHLRQILIQGHCSPAEAQRDIYGGHDLAFRRALALKEALEVRGITGGRLRLVSCASYDTSNETKSNIQRRAVITLGTYYLPGGELMENLTAPSNFFPKK